MISLSIAFSDFDGPDFFVRWTSSEVGSRLAAAEDEDEPSGVELDPADGRDRLAPTDGFSWSSDRFDDMAVERGRSWEVNSECCVCCGGFGCKEKQARPLCLHLRFPALVRTLLASDPLSSVAAQRPHLHSSRLPSSFQLLLAMASAQVAAAVNAITKKQAVVRVPCSLPCCRAV